MTTPHMKVAQLDEERLAKLRDVENELGIYLVAFELEKPVTDVSDEQARRLHRLEEELQVTLVAHQHDTGVELP